MIEPADFDIIKLAAKHVSPHAIAVANGPPEAPNVRLCPMKVL